MSTLTQIPEADIVALCDPVETQIDRCVSQFMTLGSAARFADMDSMLAAGGLDAVFIITPHTLHHPQILAGFAAGVHVACEKP